MEHVYRATIRWQHDGSEFSRGRYQRAHNWQFDGGIEVPASASPQVVRAPYSREDAVDPEEAMVAALSSCHMMTFLWLASKAGIEVAAYIDEACGYLEQNEAGRMWLARVLLRPVLMFAGPVPASATVDALHTEAHAECYIANSVKTAVSIESRSTAC